MWGTKTEKAKKKLHFLLSDEDFELLMKERV
jgi:hypothetical protein